MSTVLYRLGRRAFVARRVVIALWVLVLVVCGAAAGLLGPAFDNTFRIPGTQSQAALDQLDQRFPEVAGSIAQLVVVAPEGSRVTDEPLRGQISAAVDRLSRVEHVTLATDPFAPEARSTITDDGRAVLVNVQLELKQPEVTAAYRDELSAAVGSLRETRAQVALGGPAFQASTPGVTPTEAVGLVIAMIVLAVTFGSLLAAGLPLLIALVGVAVSMAVVAGASALLTVSSTAPLLALMIGLAVGIDYALFILSRHRDQLADGMAPEESAARAVATAGSAVVFAGLTVVVALLGLLIVPIPFLGVMGVAAAFAVVVAVLASLTLLPALFGVAGGRLAPRGRALRRATAPHGAGLAARWARLVTRVPLLTIVLVLGVLSLAAVPAAQLRLALPDNGAAPAGSPERIAYTLIDEHFGPGFNGPLLVTADVLASNDPLGVVQGLAGAVAETPGVAEVIASTPNRNGDLGIVALAPTSAPSSPETAELVQRLRDLGPELQEGYGVEIAVTGQTAVQIDVTQRLREALLPFAVTVVGLCLVLLLLVFRSVAVPVKAAVGYLFSVGAAFGAVVAVFQWGWLAETLHVARTGPVISFLPIILMGVLFGLAMDYEVFLVARMHEEYTHRGGATRSVHVGFAASARVVTAAALIMTGVFAAFVPEGDANIKPMALALAVGVAVDAFLVRMTLVPAVLVLLGDRAWWLPQRLGRRLPAVDVEGEGLVAKLELDAWRTPPGAALTAEGIGVDGPDGQFFAPVDVMVPQRGVLVVEGPPGPGRTGLLLALAGRAPLARGRLRVAGSTLPGHRGEVLARVALGGLAGVNEPDAASTVGALVRERLRLRTLSLRVPARDVRALLTTVDAALADPAGPGCEAGANRTGADRTAGPGRRPDPRGLVESLDPVRRSVLAAALGLVGHPQALVLEEPAGLDPGDRRRWWRAVVALTHGPGTTAAVLVVATSDAGAAQSLGTPVAPVVVALRPPDPTGHVRGPGEVPSGEVPSDGRAPELAATAVTSSSEVSR